MNGEHEKWCELLPWYVTETLDGRTRAALETHLRECPACQKELVAWQRISTAVRAQAAPALPPALRHRLLAQARPRPRAGLRLLPLLVRSQLPVIRTEIWPASTLVFALGVLVTLMTTAPEHGALPFVLAAPVVAAVGIAFIYGPAVDPALEIELAVPTPPRLILLARLALVFGFDLALGLAASALLALIRPGISLWPLVAAWLAPMAFLSALSLLLSVLTADPGAGALVSLGLWIALNAGRFTSLPWRIPDLTGVAMRPWLLLLALMMGGLALWLGGREEHWLRRQV